MCVEQCQDCGMNHELDDKAACIEGHGDDEIVGGWMPISEVEKIVFDMMEPPKKPKPAAPDA